MLLHASHKPHQSNSLQANRKRKHDVVVVDPANPANNFTYKRPRSTHPQHLSLTSLPTEEQYRQAAEILRVPVTHLRSVIPDVEEVEVEPQQLLPYYDWPLSQQSPRMKGAMSRGRNTPKPRSTGSMAEKAVGGEINNYTEEQGEKSALQLHGQMDGSPEFPGPTRQGGRDSTFCFPKGVFVDFFTNWCSVDDEPSHGNEYGKLIG